MVLKPSGPETVSVISGRLESIVTWSDPGALASPSSASSPLPFPLPSPSSPPLSLPSSSPFPLPSSSPSPSSPAGSSPPLLPSSLPSSFPLSPSPSSPSSPPGPPEPASATVMVMLSLAPVPSVPSCAVMPYEPAAAGAVQSTSAPVSGDSWPAVADQWMSASLAPEPLSAALSLSVASGATVSAAALMLMLG